MRKAFFLAALMSLVPGLWSLTAPPPNGVLSAGVHFSRYPSGLSQNSILTSLQDRQGFMWFGTYDGLNRFDGYSFKVFRMKPRSPDSLPSDWINALCEGEDGTLWVGTEGGLAAMDPRTQTFRRFPKAGPASAGLPRARVAALLREPGGTLWVGTNVGLYLVTGDGKILRRLVAGPSGTDLSNGSVTFLLRDSRRFVWIGTENGLNRLDPSTGKVRRFFPAPGTPGGRGTPNGILHLGEGKGLLWIGTQQGLFTLDPVRLRFVGLAQPLLGETARPGIQALLWKDADQLLIGTSGSGLLLWNSRDGSLRRAVNDPQDSASLPFDIIDCLCRDRSGLIWIGTMNGLCTLSDRQNAFRNLGAFPADDSRFGQAFVMFIVEDPQGKIWIGTLSQGIFCCDPRTGEVEQYRHDPKNPHSLSVDGVWGLVTDGSGRLWCATYGRGLDCLDPATRRFRHFALSPAGQPSRLDETCRTVFASRDGTLWAGTENGLKWLDPETERVHQYRLPDKSPEREVVRAITQSEDGAIWVGGLGGGLARLDPSSGRASLIRADRSGKQGPPCSGIRCLRFDRHGILWVGSDMGLSRFDPRSGRWELYSIEDGLPANTVHGIIPDDAGFLWLSTNGGLSRFNPDSGAFWNFGKADGLQSDEFNQGAYCRGRSGCLYFGGTHGTNCFWPDKIRPNTFRPPVRFTGIRVLNEPLTARPGTAAGQQPEYIDSITLNHDENVITFEFAALNFQCPERNRYRYRMEGVDNDWVSAGNRRYATYGNLSPGEYVFLVEGANNDGIRCNRPARLRIVITPPWWRAWWALALYLTLGAGAVFVLVRMRMTANYRKLEGEMLQRSLERLREIDAMKTDFLNIASHELRTPLTSVVGFARITLKKLESAAVLPTPDSGPDKTRDQVLQNMKIIVDEGERLTNLINDLLDIAKLEAGKVDWKREEVDIRELLDQSAATMEPLAAQKNLRIVVETAPALPPLVCDRNRILQVILNLLSNAIKFTEEGQIRLQAGRLDDGVLFEVRDTGIGVHPDHVNNIFDKFFQVGDSLTDRPRGTGLGLSISRQIVEHHHGRIWAEKGADGGSVFRFQIPLEPPSSESVGD